MPELFGPWYSTGFTGYDADCYSPDDFRHFYCWDSPADVHTFRCFRDPLGFLVNAVPRHPVHLRNYRHWFCSREELDGVHLEEQVTALTGEDEYLKENLNGCQLIYLLFFGEGI